ncbi:MAG: VacB/RNase II family 3'-5' exoribonuclease [Bacilli bacterium]|nr:VacB/RNase II family 3'-5' exoribonuclease [Bacilli bacterium]
MDLRETIIKNLKGKKLSSRNLCEIMHIKGGRAKAAFFSTLKQLVNEHRIYVDKDGYYHEIPLRKSKPKKQKIKNHGIIRITKDGYGQIFIENDDSHEKYTISPENLNGALDGDTVEFSTEKKEILSGFCDARVTRVISRETGKAIFEFNGNSLVPHNIYGNIKVICPKKQLENLVSGSLVLVDLGKDVIANFDKKVAFEGNVEYVLGHKDDPDIEEKAIGAKHGFYNSFSEEAQTQLSEISQIVTEKEKEGRIDLTDEIIFSIDGAHTKDRDDAISIKIDEEGNYVLGVHIADVSHYIKENTPLDLEARESGTSLYMGDSVIPMLPHELSNGICSLNEGVDRLTKTVEIVLDSDGNILEDRTKIYYSYINSKKAMTYEDVNEIIEKGNIPDGYEPYVEDLYLLLLLSRARDRKRIEEGNIDFAIADTIIGRENGELTFNEIKQHAAERIIENCMVIANEEVAKKYYRKNKPFISRNHEDPHLDRLVLKLRRLMGDGLCGGDAAYLIKKIERKSLTPYDLDNFLRKYRGTEVEEILSVDILTCMSKAFYSPEAKGHYGLGLQYYTHFTSPIRRYPDLLVHRLIDKYEKEKINNDQTVKIAGELPELCSHASFMEREADAAEQESIELKMAEYGEKHLGDEYAGQIIAFRPYGLDIKLTNNLKGTVSLDDIILPNPQDKHKLKRGQRIYAIIKDVSIPHRAIHFSLIGTDKTRAKQKIKEDSK